MPAMKPAINSKRLRTLLDGINRFGRDDATGGFNRVGYSDADMDVRSWFAAEMEGSGLAVTRDGIGNLFGRHGPAAGPTIMFGSHLDTVPDGGAFDGALGVAIALECVRAIREAGLAPGIAIEVVATAEEEGRFGGMFGSQAIAGQVTREWIDQASDADGMSLVEAMAGQRLDAHAALGAARQPGTVKAFLELHVEQGPMLEAAGIPVGIAHTVAGVRNLRVCLTGVANHSGTTPMQLRADAFAGLAALGAAIPDIIARHGTGNTRVTIGKVELFPNHVHTIPGRAEFVINIRDTDPDVLERMANIVETETCDAAEIHGLSCDVEVQSRIDPVALDGGLVALLREEAAALGLDALAMPSGAGHDAQTMQSLCPSALIFVPSRGGISHSPAEWTEWEDIEKGAALMLAALCRLCGPDSSV